MYTTTAVALFLVNRAVESFQDFFIKLDMKPCMHLVEITVFHSIMSLLLLNLAVTGERPLEAAQKCIQGAAKEGTRRKLYI